MKLLAVRAWDAKESQRTFYAIAPTPAVALDLVKAWPDKQAVRTVAVMHEIDGSFEGPPRVLGYSGAGQFPGDS